MEYFDSSGHLTKDAIKEIVHGDPPELLRLEAAEHISFCDRCLDMYIKEAENALRASPQLSPEALLKRVERKSRSHILKRYFSAGVAAVIAVSMYGAGIFDFHGYEYENMTEPIRIVAEKYSVIAEKAYTGYEEGRQKAFAKFENGKIDFLGSLREDFKNGK